MNNVLSRTTVEPRKYRLMVNYLVGLFIPFVDYINSIFIPFVCKNTPYSSFRPVARRVRGFTLIELVVTVAVAAILVVVAVPNMRTFIQNGRLSTQVNDLKADLGFAYSTALNRPSTNIGVCRSSNGTSCTVGGNWRDGRAIFDDVNNNGTWEAGDTILRFREPLASATDTLAANPSIPAIIFFNPNGYKPFVTNVPADGVFVFCDDRGPTKGKQINLNAMGQVVVKSVPPATCTP